MASEVGPGRLIGEVDLGHCRRVASARARACGSAFDTLTINDELLAAGAPVAEPHGGVWILIGTCRTPAQRAKSAKG
jgi:hypothetical protein